MTLTGFDVRCGRNVKISDPSLVDYSKEYMCVSVAGKSGSANEKWVAYDPKALNTPRRQPSETVDISRFDTFTYSNVDDFKVDNSASSLMNFDRPEFSDHTKAEENTFVPYECPTAAEFFTNDSIGLKLISGIPGLIPTEERIAEVFGGMAKRLDDAYSKGKFTEDEYNELNDMIAKGMELETTRAENAKAFRELYSKHISDWVSGKSNSIDFELRSIRERIMTPEQLMAEREAQIAGYARKYCRYDRSAILNMFNSVRYGK